MKVTLVESSVGRGSHQQILASYLINDTVCLDAGVLGFITPLDVQKKVEHVFLSHSHLDHIASLPIFIDNVYTPGPECPIVYGSAVTLGAVRDHLFNDVVWPDMIRLSGEETPFLRLQELQPEVPVACCGLKVTGVELDHVLPTLGFIVEAPDAAVAFISDTSPTDRIWELINATPQLKAVFLECSFPDSMAWLADKAKHLTPAMFKSELQKLKRDVRIFSIHIKTAFDAKIRSEIAALNLPNVSIGEPGSVYEF